MDIYSTCRQGKAVGKGQGTDSQSHCPTLGHRVQPGVSRSVPGGGGVGSKTREGTLLRA